MIGILLLSTACSSLVTLEAKGTRNGEAIIPSNVTYAIFPTGEVDKDRSSHLCPSRCQKDGRTGV